MRGKLNTSLSRDRFCKSCEQPFTVRFPSDDRKYCSPECSPWTHRLSNIDNATRAALCAECGPVKLHKRSGGWMCARRAPGPVQSYRTHHLSRIDTEVRHAVCADCGPVRIWRAGWGPVVNGSKWQCSKGTVQRNERTHYRRHLADRCERCGFVPEDPCQLDINHRDANHKNREQSNMETLCANCHRLVSKRQRNSWDYRGGRWVKSPLVVG